VKAILTILALWICLSLVYGQVSAAGTTGSAPAYLLAQKDSLKVTQLKLTTQESYEVGQTAGARSKAFLGWGVAGFVSGACTGPIGILVVGLMANKKIPQNIPANCDTLSYRAGYLQKTRSKNTWYAVDGGTMVFVGAMSYLFWYSLNHVTY